MQFYYKNVWNTTFEVNCLEHKNCKLSNQAIVATYGEVRVKRSTLLHFFED